MVQADIDEDDRLFLRFVRYPFFDEVMAGQSIALRTIQVPKEERPAGKDTVAEKYAMIEMSGEVAAELIRTERDRGLFTKPYGPFHRIPHERAARISEFSPWRR